MGTMFPMVGNMASWHSSKICSREKDEGLHGRRQGKWESSARKASATSTADAGEMGHFQGDPPEAAKIGAPARRTFTDFYVYASTNGVLFLDTLEELCLEMCRRANNDEAGSASEQLA